MLRRFVLDVLCTRDNEVERKESDYRIFGVIIFSNFIYESHMDLDLLAY